MADVRPFRALRYNPELDLTAVVCPPFDTIPPQLQKKLYARSPYNAVRIELALATNGSRYENAARTLHEWIADGTLHRDTLPAFYLLQQTFPYDGRSYTRMLLFARLRVVPWSEGAVLPHEQTFPKHKQDRLELMRAAHINGSPIFLFYRDPVGHIHDLLEQGERDELPVADFDGIDGQHLRLTRIAEPAVVEELERAFVEQTLYVADGHHRYETALMYREEARAKAAKWTGGEAENFALVGLVASEDAGLLVLPTHRVSAGGDAWPDVRSRLAPLFSMEPVADFGVLESRVGGIGLAAEGELFILTPKDAAAIDKLQPQDRSPEWRALDYAICDHAILRGCLRLTEEEMKDQAVVWFTEDAAAAVKQMRDRRARYAVVLKSVPVERVLELADAGERMPQKSTFFYPKVPTGLVFNLLED